MNSLSILKHRFFPSFYKNEAPKLIEFFKYYLEWMEQEGNPYWQIDKISDFTNIDGTIDLYISHLKNELMINFPIEYAGELRYIMKHLVMLYQSKGTIDSFKFFFRAIYNSFCDISYPRENILKVSDGKWIQGYYVYSQDIKQNEFTSLIGKTVIEVETGVTGLINNTIPHFFNGETEVKYCLVITENKKQFKTGNTLKVYDTEKEYTITQTEYSKGYWEGTDGFISADKLLQDGFYYQNFSYVITSLVSIEEYKDIIERLLHPAGLQMFGRVQLVENVEPISKVPTTFLHWWVIFIFIHVLAEEKKLILNSFTIKNNPNIFIFPWISDQQYYNKQYDIVEKVKDITPNQLYNKTNNSNKLVFSDGKLINVDWINYKLYDSIMNYNIVGINSAEPIIKTKCENGVITLSNDHKTSEIVFIFVNGVKIRDSYIIKTKTGYKIPSNITGDTIIYSLQNIITRVIKKEINTNTIVFKSSDKKRILPFVNGEFIWNNVKYINDKIILPQSTGYIELYEFINNENLFVNSYYIKNNKLKTLYCTNILKNIIF